MPLIEAVFGDAGSLGLGFEAESAKAAPKIKEIKTGTQAVQHTQLAVGMKLAEVGGKRPSPPLYIAHLHNGGAARAP